MGCRMGIAEVLAYACSIVFLTIYIKWSSYKKGFSDGVKYFSDIVADVLRHINQLQKEAEEAGMPFKAYIESIKPLNK